MSEIAKCAWCQKEPVTYSGHCIDPTTDVYCCRCQCAQSETLVREDWNTAQHHILAARYKDFQAGQRTVFGNPMSTFDDYLKEAPSEK